LAEGKQNTELLPFIGKGAHSVTIEKLNTADAQRVPDQNPFSLYHGLKYGE
jgi:hypothetical protein